MHYTTLLTTPSSRQRPGDRDADARAEWRRNRLAGPGDHRRLLILMRRLLAG